MSYVDLRVAAIGKQIRDLERERTTLKKQRTAAKGNPARITMLDQRLRVLERQLAERSARREAYQRLAPSAPVDEPPVED